MDLTLIAHDIGSVVVSVGELHQINRNLRYRGQCFFKNSSSLSSHSSSKTTGIKKQQQHVVEIKMVKEVTIHTSCVRDHKKTLGAPRKQSKAWYLVFLWPGLTRTHRGRNLHAYIHRKQKRRLDIFPAIKKLTGRGKQTLFWQINKGVIFQVTIYLP